MKRESALHCELKTQYAGYDGETEVPVCGLYVCDGVRADGELVEVQTGSFAPLKEKVLYLARENRVRVAHPIIVSKSIELFDKNGALLHIRKSPRKGSKWDVFKALVYGWEIAALRNVVIELVFVDVAEQRVDDGRGSWRRRGVSLAGKRVTSQYPPLELRRPADYAQFAPFAPHECWTTADLAQRARITRNLAGKTAFVLSKLGVAERVGKRGRFWEYATVVDAVSQAPSQSEPP
jgi:hypothetical protein